MPAMHRWMTQASRTARTAQRLVGKAQRRIAFSSAWLSRRVRRLFRWPRPQPEGVTPSPGVTAFLEGETMRQVAYFVGSADSGIVDPREDWPGAVADAHGVVRAHIHRLNGRIVELQQALIRVEAEKNP